MKCDLPFELRVLEAILIRVCKSLREELESLKPEFHDALTDLEGKKVNWEKQMKLLQVKVSGMS